jgi:hypothetical protein
MTPITTERLDAVQADLDAAYHGVANEQHHEREARLAAQRRVFDALDDDLLPALRRIIAVRDAAIARGRAAEADTGIFLTVIDADEITTALGDAGLAAR